MLEHDMTKKPHSDLLLVQDCVTLTITYYCSDIQGFPNNTNLCESLPTNGEKKYGQVFS